MRCSFVILLGLSLCGACSKPIGPTETWEVSIDQNLSTWVGAYRPIEPSPALGHADTVTISSVSPDAFAATYQHKGKVFIICGYLPTVKGNCLLLEHPRLLWREVTGGCSDRRITLCRQGALLFGDLSGKLAPDDISRMERFQRKQ